MMLLPLPLLTLGFAVLASASAVPQSDVFHEKRDDHLTQVLTKRDRLASDVVLPMRIVLTQSSPDEAHQWLIEAAHPDSANYEKSWSQDDVIDRFTPSDETVNSVLDWVHSSGISPERITHSDDKQWLGFDASTEEAEQLVNAEYHVYEAADGELSAGCDAYHIPNHLRDHIDYITPGVKGVTVAKGNLRREDRSTAHMGCKVPGCFRHSTTEAPQKRKDRSPGHMGCSTPGCFRHSTTEAHQSRSTGHMGCSTPGCFRHTVAETPQKRKDRSPGHMGCSTPGCFRHSTTEAHQSRSTGHMGCSTPGCFRHN